ncbi:MAG: DUF2852 domain-containing protein [Ahrensia sp.]|nr:DUF2852 domain-containing protein [Ahrensia sp.]
MTQSALIRPAWTPATIAMMVVGFMIFWPLGLAMLAYIIWGERLEGVKRDLNKATDNIAANFKGRGYTPTHAARTGNVAFDDWREAELARLNEERRKLDEMRADFDNYSRELRRAKDQDEFDRFMATRNAPSAKSKKNDKSTLRISDDD